MRLQDRVSRIEASAGNIPAMSVEEIEGAVAGYAAQHAARAARGGKPPLIDIDPAQYRSGLESAATGWPQRLLSMMAPEDFAL